MNRRHTETMDIRMNQMKERAFVKFQERKELTSVYIKKKKSQWLQYQEQPGVRLKMTLKTYRQLSCW